ncbi:MAG TPA: protoglobin domain-containing protein [bacterium]
MLSAAKLKEHYAFTDDDARRLALLRPFMEAAKDRVAEEFYRFVVATPETAAFVEGQPERETRHRVALAWWFAQLFRGEYDDRYFQNLERIGATHVRIGLPGHFVNAAASLLRTIGHGLIRANIEERADAAAAAESFDRILDMNLDVLTSSYREAELRKVLVSARLDEKLLVAAERFSSALKLVLVLSLMGISLGVVAVFVRDAMTLVSHRDVHSVLSALGSLLVIWVMVELMENEIRQLRGGRFKITIFLGVALVAFIREMLISSLEPQSDPRVNWFLLGAILTIGVVYWLITRAEAQRGPGA